MKGTNMEGGKLITELESAAARYGITVGVSHSEIVLDAPEGFRFEAALHSLVSARWDGEPVPNVIRRAIRDVVTYGPRIHECPSDCACKE
jgi:hypothetical protein